MSRQVTLSYGLVLVASIMGIAGMSIMFNGFMHGSFVEVTRGVPLFLVGLWWDGRELSRSMAASRARKMRAPTQR
jgi:hypothetical protein